MSTSETRINGLDARGSMFLQTIPAVWQNFEDWPVPAASTVPANRQERFKRLCKAARLFLLKQPMNEVLEAAGVGDRQPWADRESRSGSAVMPCGRTSAAVVNRCHQGAQYRTSCLRVNQAQGTTNDSSVGVQTASLSYGQCSSASSAS